MNFSELKRGDVFMIADLDADGYEPSWYVINKRKGVLYGGNVHGQGRTTAEAEHLSPDTEVIKTSRIRLHGTPTEVERVAITLLAQHTYIIHFVLREWIAALLENVDYAVPLYRYYDENRNEIRKECDKRGYMYSRSWNDWGNSVFSLIFHATPAGQYQYDHPVSRQYRADGGLMDTPAMLLANELVTYRRMERPSGDYSFAIMGTGGPLKRVSTSLAAHVVEYHRRMMALLEGEV